MSTTSDLTVITSGDSSAALHPAWPAFVREMHGRNLDRLELQTAWIYFRSGWEAIDWHRPVTAENMTDDQMSMLRAEEFRSGYKCRHEVVYAIDRIRGHATVKEQPGDRELVVDAWNQRHAGVEP